MFSYLTCLTRRRIMKRIMMNWQNNIQETLNYCKLIDGTAQKRNVWEKKNPLNSELYFSGRGNSLLCGNS